MPRRALLRALGLGGAGVVARARTARSAAAPLPPRRIVFYIQPHGHVPNAFRMPVSGPADAVATRSVLDLAEPELSETLRPLHRHRRHLLAVEGLSHTSVLWDIAEVLRRGADEDANNHSIAVAGLLTGQRAAQHPGFPCAGGAISIDQLLSQRLAGPARFASRVYGSEYVPNLTAAPFSFLGASQASPLVGDPAAAFLDLLGRPSSPGSRESVLQTFRGSVLDTVAREYELLLPRLPPASRRTLDEHRALVRDLERSLRLDRGAACEAPAPLVGKTPSQFMRLIRLAFACDLTRVVTYVAPVPAGPEFGYPADAAVHAAYAHASVQGATSCDTVYSPLAERAMTDLSVWNGNHLALLLDELDSVVEGDGTLLDHTVVVWLTELGTPTHQHHDAPVVLAGGCHRFFRTGRYIRYPATVKNPLAGQPPTGPGHNRLFVSLLQAMGQTDETFGLPEVSAADGSPISLRGPLRELHTTAA